MSRGDRWLLVLPLALTAVGLVMVYSSSPILGITRYQDPDHFLVKQLMRVVVGLLVFALVSLRADLKWIERYAPQLLGGAVALLAVLVVAGHAAGGAVRWIRLGTMTLQPTDSAPTCIAQPAVPRAIPATQIRAERSPRRLAIGRRGVTEGAVLEPRCWRR